MDNADNVEKKAQGAVPQKYSLGYFMPQGITQVSFSDCVRENRELISEVYFPMPGAPSGRSPLGVNIGLEPKEVMKRFYADLDLLGELDIPGVVLFNATCYGGNFASKAVCDYIVECMEECRKHVKIFSVTTTSPMFAQFFHEKNLGVAVRASVNMRIGTVEQMDSLSSLFDGFYLQREFNRDLKHVRSVRKWCDEHGKTLHMLANSGCLYMCPFHEFHNNTIAHISQEEYPTSPLFTSGLCRDVLANNPVQVLRNSWVRPEDIHHYYGLFDTIKLASRTHYNPGELLRAYGDERFDGNIIDLLEPGWQAGNAPYLSNRELPDDWFEYTSHCGHHCTECSYCENVYKKIRK